MIREYHDLGILGAVFLLALLLLVLFFWVTEPVIVERDRSEFEMGVRVLVGEVEIREERSGEELPVLRLMEFDDGSTIAELLVRGYRNEIRYLSHLSADGELLGAVVLRESEAGSHDWFLRDREILTEVLNGGALPEEVPATTVTVQAMIDGVERARAAISEGMQ